MAIWLVRAGSGGEYEQRFLAESKVYVTWDSLDVNLAKLKSQEELRSVMADLYADVKPNTVKNWASQVWPFAHDMQKGDLVVVPFKSQPVVYIGEVVGDYQHIPNGTSPFFHSRQVKWIGEAIPRTNFSQDLLYSFGAFMTICRIQRNNAEERIKAMRANKWQPESVGAVTGASASSSDDSEQAAVTDLASLAQDQIARLIGAKFKGHKFTRLIESVLQAQGYTTWRSPEGADGGADILAGAGPMGFGAPRLVVEVKSESGPIDRPTVDKLIGAIDKFRANEGLFVSWGGFRQNVQKELASSFFRVRLWNQTDVLEHLFANYDKLDEELKAELPLKRIWVVAAQD